MVQHLDKNNLFNDGQHGFRCGHSCLSQLSDHHERIIKEPDHEKLDIDVVYLDFSKAFDKVDHTYDRSQ